MNTVKYYWVSLRKIKGNFYARVRWKNAWNLKQEQTITLKTDKEDVARRRLKKVKVEAEDIANGDTTPHEFKTLFNWQNEDGTSRHTSLQFKHIIPEYLKYRKCVVSEGSYERDGYSLKQLTNVLGDKKVIRSLNYKDIAQKFIPYYEKKGYSNSGINLNLRTLKVFFNYLLKEKLINEKIEFKMLPEDNEPCYINRAEIKALHKMVDEKWRRWFYFYEKTGCRARDPFKGYLDGDVWKITPKETKTKHWHYYPLTDELKSIWMELQDLRQSYEDKKKSREQAIDSCYHLVQKNMWRSINKLKWSGVVSKNKKLTLKSFRHTFGIINVKKTGDIHKVMQMLNHKRLETTQEYLDMPDYLLAQDFPELQHLVDNSPNLQGEPNPDSANSSSPLHGAKSNEVGNSGWVTRSDVRRVS